jgi:hypothetical protein
MWAADQESKPCKLDKSLNAQFSTFDGVFVLIVSSMTVWTTIFSSIVNNGVNFETNPIR